MLYTYYVLRPLLINQPPLILLWLDVHNNKQ